MPEERVVEAAHVVRLVGRPAPTCFASTASTDWLPTMGSRPGRHRGRFASAAPCRGWAPRRRCPHAPRTRRRSPRLDRVDERAVRGGPGDEREDDEREHRERHARPEAGRSGYAIDMRRTGARLSIRPKTLMTPPEQDVGVEDDHPDGADDDQQARRRSRWRSPSPSLAEDGLLRAPRQDEEDDDADPQTVKASRSGTPAELEQRHEAHEHERHAEIERRRRRPRAEVPRADPSASPTPASTSRRRRFG